VRAGVRPLVGLASIAVVAGLVAVSAALFRDDFTETVPVTVLSPRAGLVMNPDAKVTIHGVQIGKVESIEVTDEGGAAIRLAIDPARLSVVPANTSVDITSSTVFGAKAIRFIPPENPSPESIHAGQTLGADRVMLEVNTLFEQLVTVLSAIQPEKLNQTLGAIAAALNGRGEQVGQTLSDLNTLLGRINPHIDTLNRDLADAPAVLRSYADATPELLSIAESATQISHTVVDAQQDLDELLISAIGLADIGNQVLTDNGKPLADVLALLLPITALTDEYHEALTCGIGGIGVMANNPPLDEPGVEVLAGFFWGADRYRYPTDLPKVAASGGPQCTDLPKVPYGKAPPFVITDSGTNPWKYGNPGVVLNSDLIKQILFGPIAGPPRNSAQIGQPG
jgi:phospholipid/cholesterol/gamma-HCH transport system substrate-binding protein